jgi:hypothetical protein
MLVSLLLSNRDRESIFPKSKNVVANIIARVIRARRKNKAALGEKTFHKNTRAEVLAMSLIGSKIVACHANLANARHRQLCPKQGAPLSAFDMRCL